MHLKFKPACSDFLFFSVLVISILIFSGCVGQEETATTTTPETKETTTITTPETKETTTATTKKPLAPSNLTKTNEFPCTIEWTDNSDNEDGFNIYIGGSCVDCEATTEWILVDTVGKDVITYTWTKSCCSVAECSCAMVRAFNESGESLNSNIIMLAPVC